MKKILFALLLLPFISQAQIPAYKIVVDNTITNKTLAATVTPLVVGSRFKELADILQTVIDSTNKRVRYTDTTSLIATQHYVSTHGGGSTDTTGFGLATRKMLVDTAAALRSAIGTGGGGSGTVTFTTPSAFTPTGSGTSAIGFVGNGNSTTQVVNGAGGLTLVSNLPVSTATQAAIDLKANIASPTFTGTVGGITKSMVGLSSVDNTSDASKPVSTATQTALDGKAALSHTHAASDITSGTIGSARLGSGTANSGTVLYGDGTWKTASSVDTTSLSNRINRQPLIFNVTDYGANPNDTLDDAVAIYNTILACKNAGGGEVYLPAPRNNFGYHYYAKNALVTSLDGVNPNCQIPIPLCKITDTFSNGTYKFITIKILGESPPNFSSEGGATLGRNMNGVIIESTIQGTGAIPSVFGTSYYNAGITGNRNFVKIDMENVIVRTCTKSGNTDIAGTMSAINFENLIQFRCNNVKADISSTLTSSVLPTNSTYGIIFPSAGNKGECGGETIYAEGYRRGVFLGEHFICQNLIVYGNYIAVTVPLSNHTIYIGMLNPEANVIDLQTLGTSNIVISEWEGERYVASGYWFDGAVELSVGSGSPANITILSCEMRFNGGTFASFVVDNYEVHRDYRILGGYNQTEFYLPYSITQFIFTTLDYWGTAGHAPVVATDGTISKLYLNGSGAASVLYRQKLFIPGDYIRVTVEAVNNTTGSAHLAIGNAGTPEFDNVLTNGKNVFDINTTGFTQDIIQMYVNSGDAAFIRSIKVEKL